MSERKYTEVDKLQEVNADLNESLRLAAEANKDLMAEIERLRGERDMWRNTAYHEASITEEQEVKAIKEFAERVINLIYSADDINPITEWQIDNIVTEMTEGK